MAMGKQETWIYSVGSTITYGNPTRETKYHELTYGEVIAERSENHHGEGSVRINSRGGDEILVDGENNIRNLIAALHEAIHFIRNNNREEG